MKKKGYSDQLVVDIATSLYKHQNFSGEAMIRKVKSDYYKPATLKAMQCIMRRYLNTGDRSNKRVQPLFYDTLDNCKKLCIQPLTPSAYDRAGAYASKRESLAKAREVKRLKALSKQNSQCWGIQADNGIVLFKNEDQMSGYFMCLEHLKSKLSEPIEFKKVKVSVAEV